MTESTDTVRSLPLSHERVSKHASKRGREGGRGREKEGAREKGGEMEGEQRHQKGTSLYDFFLVGETCYGKVVLNLILNNFPIACLNFKQLSHSNITNLAVARETCDP